MSADTFYARLDRTTARLMEQDQPHAMMFEAAREALRHARANNEGMSFKSGAIVNAERCTCERAATGETCLHQYAWRIWTDAP